MLSVERHAESALEMADRAHLLIGGGMAYSGPAQAIADDRDLQQPLLGGGPDRRACAGVWNRKPADGREHMR